MDPLFIEVAGFPCAVMPFDANGNQRFPDGVNIFSIDQAVVHWTQSGATASSLRTLWQRYYDEAMLPSATGDRSAQITRLRRSEFRALSDADFAEYLRICQTKNLDPLTRPIYPVAQRVDGRTRIEWRYPINTIRILAEDTGESAGSDAAQFVFNEDERHPYRASVTVYKAVKGGQRIAYTGVATWDEFYPGPGFWDRMPALKLGNCAEAQAWRKAFPRQLQSVFGLEEVKQTDGPPASIEWDHHRQRPWPQTFFDFQLALGEMGILEPGRAVMIRQLRDEVGATETDEQFYRAALQRIYEVPAAYGASPPRADDSGEAGAVASA